LSPTTVTGVSERIYRLVCSSASKASIQARAALQKTLQETLCTRIDYSV
jgi:hypothetical protein